LGSNIIKIGQTLEILVLGRASMSAKIRKLSYKVRKGDSLYLIGKRFSVSVSDIKKWNSIDDKKYLQPGQKLTLFINPMII
jgi:membrane-bound lytic murein transglycosylase D